MFPALDGDHPISRDEYGGKAYSLAVAARHGLAVPAGFGLSAFDARRVADQAPGIGDRLEDAVAAIGGYPVAVRSSAIDEDGSTASFAGQYLTRLEVADITSLVNAVAEVAASATAQSVSLYRARIRVAERKSCGVLVQQQLAPRAAGVLFTTHPVTMDSDTMVLEAAPGLGSGVVDGAALPERWLLTRSRPIAHLEARYEDRDTQILDDRDLLQLRALGHSCEDVFGASQDIEWAIDAAGCNLLQVRPITTR